MLDLSFEQVTLLVHLVQESCPCMDDDVSEESVKLWHDLLDSLGRELEELAKDD